MIKVNLLSPEKKEVAGGAEGPSLMEEERASKINVPAIVAAVAITLGTMGFLYITQTQTIDNKQELLAEKRARKAELDNVLKTLAQLEKTKNSLEKKVKVIGDLKNQQKTTVRMMDELSKALPDWVWLTKLTFSKNVMNLDGKALSNNLIADFMNNLESTGYFTNIQLKTSRRAKQGGTDIFNFTLSCIFVKPTTKGTV